MDAVQGARTVEECIAEAHTTEARLETYRRTAAEAIAEIDDLQSDILSTQVRLTSMMARVKALESLIVVVGDLVGDSEEHPAMPRPVRVESRDPGNGAPLPVRQVRIEGLSPGNGASPSQHRRDRGRVRVPAFDATLL
jgi:hypothetical protein